MKNKVVYLLLLFMLYSKIQAQTIDTVFEYETIVVYDTVKVYDTIKIDDKNLAASTVSDSFFKNNNSVEKAVLAIDTANQNAELVLFNKNDTATISINSIIVTENLNNSDTMKNKIVTLAAAALLAQTAFANKNVDTSSVTNIVYSENNKDTTNIKDTLKAQGYSIETVVFQNKKNPEKTYEVTLPATHNIRFKSRKTRRVLNGTTSWLYIDKIGPGIITHISNSTVTIKFHPIIKKKINREYSNALKKIRKDETLSKEEREKKYFELTYTDSVQVPLESIKSMGFSKFNNKHKKFNTFGGFNEQRKKNFVTSTSDFTCALIPLIIVPAVMAGTITLSVILLVESAILVTSILPRAIATKRINLNHWELKK